MLSCKQGFKLPKGEVCKIKCKYLYKRNKNLYILYFPVLLHCHLKANVQKQLSSNYRYSLPGSKCTKTALI